MNRRLLIACCSPLVTPDWRWVSGRLDSDRYDWRFYNARPRHRWERLIRRPNLARLRACRELARCVRREPVDLVVTHQPIVTCWSEILMRRPVGCPHLAFAFNFTHLPRGVRRTMMRRAFATVDRFVVFSGFERELYSTQFDIPVEKIDMLHWGVQAPDVPAESAPLESGAYICAVGSQARDYACLIEAMRLAPSIRLVLVARPENVRGLSIPENVSLRLNIPRDDVYNIMRHSRFLVLPLLHSQVPCGHVTLVTAMYLGKAVLATESAGIADYVQPDQNGRFCPPGDPGALAQNIALLWNDPVRCERLGANGRQFAAAHCTEQATVEYMRSILEKVETVGRI